MQDGHMDMPAGDTTWPRKVMLWVWNLLFSALTQRLFLIRALRTAFTSLACWSSVLLNMMILSRYTMQTLSLRCRKA